MNRQQRIQRRIIRRLNKSFYLGEFDACCDELRVIADYRQSERALLG